jgi:hypothetical protein
MMEVGEVRKRGGCAEGKSSVISKRFLSRGREVLSLPRKGSRTSYTSRSGVDTQIEGGTAVTSKIRGGRRKVTSSRELNLVRLVLLVVRVVDTAHEELDDPKVGS